MTTQLHTSWNAKEQAKGTAAPSNVERRMPAALEAASAAGQQVSPSRMRRLLRAEQAEQISSRRVISYADPTGEAAVRNADPKAGRR